MKNDGSKSNMQRHLQKDPEKSSPQYPVSLHIPKNSLQIVSSKDLEAFQSSVCDQHEEVSGLKYLKSRPLKIITDNNKSVKKIPSLNSSAQDSLNSALKSATMRKRKPTHSITEVNTPIYLNEFTTFKAAVENPLEKRNQTRNQTEIISTDRSKICDKSKNFMNDTHEIPKKNRQKNKHSKAFENLSQNYKIETTPARVNHKEKYFTDLAIACSEFSSQDLEVTNERIIDSQESRKIIERNSVETGQNAPNLVTHKTKMRSSSIGSINEVVFSEAHSEIISELSKSIKELHNRICKNEEINMTSIHENLMLKKAIINLENKIDDKKINKIEKEQVTVGCTNSCSIF